MVNNFPPTVVALPPMTHAKCLEILTAMHDHTHVYDEQDIKSALAFAKACVIADKLNLARGG